jgi:hypothetical protein
MLLLLRYFQLCLDYLHHQLLQMSLQRLLFLGLRFLQFQQRLDFLMLLLFRLFLRYLS